MAISLAEIIILCLLADWAFKRLGLPGLVGMIAVGALMGPQALGLLDPVLLDVGADLRMIALIVILLRAGFELSRESLNKVGRNALLLAFLPGLLEAATVAAFGPYLLPLTRLECAVLGYVLAAVSPAVVVPRMIAFNEKGLGTAKGLPTLVLAGASVDDVTAIVAYGVLMGIYAGAQVNIGRQLAGIPVSIVAGIIAGLLIGVVLYRLFDRFNPRATKRALAVIGVSIFLVQLGTVLEKRNIPFAPLLAVMAIGFIILEKRERMAHEISGKFGKIWVFAEILLFALVGAQVKFQAAADAGFRGAALILIGLAGRSVGSWICTLGAGFTWKEKLFVVISYLPKATVQAAIGSAPLAIMAARGMPTAPGDTILAVAVMAIVITAPLGAWAINWAGPALLAADGPSSGADVRRAAAESDALLDDEDRI